MSRPEAAASFVPDADTLAYLPLGGTGEIGMNLNLYGHAGAWLMVDCGMMVDRDRPDGILLPDPRFVAEQADRLVGLVLTHAHQDHLGALPWLWPALRCPIWATPFTAEVLRRQLARRGVPFAGLLDLRTARPGRPEQIGPFSVEWVTLTHSIPEPCAVILETPAGTVLHTGDWKLEEAPVVGDAYDRARLERLGRSRPLAMVGDSTNATVEGSTPAEASLEPGLERAVREAGGGRVVVGCFSSNVARLVTLGRVAVATGRRLCMLGRAIEHMVGAARGTGYWGVDVSWVPARDIGYLPRDEVLAVATGSQGEPRAALDRLAAGNHRDLDLEPGDTVILSARQIPGNEEAIARLCERLRARGVRVVGADGEHHIHASGHPARDDLRRMYGWVRPRIAVPTHGEARHLDAHAELARECGVETILPARNGTVCRLAPGRPGIVARVPTGRLRVERDDDEPVPVGPDLE